MRAMALAQPARSIVSPLSAGVEADYVALQAVASRSAVFRSSSTIALTRDRARRDRGAATAIAKGTSPARLATATATPLTSGSLSPKFVAQRSEEHTSELQSRLHL